MSRMWISFTNFGEPNKELGGKYLGFNNAKPAYMHGKA